MMATKIDVCKMMLHEWHNGELFVTPDCIRDNIGWLNSDSAAKVREMTPKIMKDGDFPMFAIERLPSGDKVFEVDDYIVFEGGDVMCFLKPVGRPN